MSNSLETVHWKTQGAWENSTSMLHCLGEFWFEKLFFLCIAPWEPSPAKHSALGVKFPWETQINILGAKFFSLSEFNVDKKQIGAWKIMFSRLTHVLQSATRPWSCSCDEMRAPRKAGGCPGTRAVSEVRPKAECRSEQRKSMWKAVSYFSYPGGNGTILSERSDEDFSRLLNGLYCPWNMGPKVRLLLLDKK